MRAINITIIILCLLFAGMGCMSAQTTKRVKADKYGVKESKDVELVSKKKQEDGKLTFKCRIVRNGDQYVMLAQILKNDSSVHVARPGVKFMLSDGDSMVLKPERDAACCSNWADGRWNNAIFKLSAESVAKFKSAGILSVSIPLYGGGEISRQTATGKENAIAELLRSVEEK